MHLYYDRTDPRIAFATARLIDALSAGGPPVLRRDLSRLPAEVREDSVVVGAIEDGALLGVEVADPEGFVIARRGRAIHVVGGGSRGAMYGAMDLAEQVQLAGVDGVVEKAESPFLALRGVQFNLPWEPYANGDVFAHNDRVCWDIDFWREYIDMLAVNRYNCLTLWSRHPYHLMFRLDKYPRTTALSDEKIAQNMRFFRDLFGHARDRGVDTFLITWCVDIIPSVIDGLDLPPHFADPKTSHAVRQECEPIKDYFRECVKTLLRTYPELTGLGTSGSEEMVGDTRVREKWVAETYLAGVKLSGRTVPFIHRTNGQSGRSVKELFVDEYPGQTYISWKYSNAHMYSHPKPMFEKLWGVWDEVNLDEIKVTYTVRNDDVHTLRWGDPAYVRAYVENMKRPHVQGFYWGADGYIWGDDFQHAPGGHKRWTYDFQRQWFQFALWGRTSYNPTIPEDLWRRRFLLRYGAAGAELYAGLQAGSKIVPAVSRLFWIDYDFQWHPESCLSVYGFKTIEDFVDGEPMPAAGVVGVAEYARARHDGRTPEGITPPEIIEELDRAADAAHAAAQALRDRLGPEGIDDELECVMLDIEAWSHLGRYYREKFTAAGRLAMFRLNGDIQAKADAVAALERGRDAWIRLGEVWAQHYLPYRMARTGHTFGWPLHLPQVEQDIELAIGFHAAKE